MVEENDIPTMCVLRKELSEIDAYPCRRPHFFYWPGPNDWRFRMSDINRYRDGGFTLEQISLMTGLSVWQVRERVKGQKKHQSTTSWF